jgi:protein involved in polysaccharide export with SLBB domain
MKFCKTRLFFVTLFCFFACTLFSQVPSDLSTVRASQISDNQLQQFVTQAKSRGLNAQDLENELLRRGLPASEMSILKQRIELMGFDGGTSNSMGNGFGKDTSAMGNGNTKRKTTNIDNDALYGNLLKKESRIFGAELFSNTNLSFEPNLKMATPKNYSIGPEDELLLSIYGLNIMQQNLKVSPDGTVNIRYAGVINMNGLTIENASALLESRLAKYYPALKTGQTKLQLSLGNIRSIRVVLIGAIARPGTYTLPSLASLFNALYLSGGPSENGSFRNIELIRNNKVAQVADLYEFLVKGYQQSNIRLEDNDVIRVPYAKTLITINGLVNRPGIFEAQPKETLADILEYAGGFKSSAFRGRITGKRYADFDRTVLDIGADSTASFALRNGDEFLVDSLINRYQNRVIVNGAVFKPGPYALENDMTIRALIDKAQGVREDVFYGRAILVRTRPDLTKEYFNIDLRSILTGNSTGILLQKEDSIHIASIFDLVDSTTVSINGAVRRPGVFRYADSLSLKALVIKAGGFADNATGTGIEVSRRKHDIEVNKVGSKIVELIRVDDNKDLSGATNDLILRPYDIITVKADPYYKKQISVKISGEVLMPAIYTLQSREERLSSIISRSGGLLYTANIRGAKLVRLNKEDIDSNQVKRLLRALKKDTALKQDTVITKPTRDVAIDLAYILKHPGSEDDIMLEEGDELVVPRINNTVSIEGEVYKPVDVMYERGKSMRDYISAAGGTTVLGKRGRAFVIYANGSSAKIKHVLGVFRNYPKIQPGSNIYVPQKPKRDGSDLARAGIMMSAVTALLTAVALIFK